LRALKLAPPDPESQATDALRRWAQRQRELALEAKLDRLTAALEHLVAVLERAA